MLVIRTLAFVAVLTVALKSAAEDISFKRAKLTSARDLKESPVIVTVTNTGISIKGKIGSAVDREILFASIGRITYGTTDRRRLREGALVAPILMTTKAQKHWLVIELTHNNVAENIVLQLDKTEFRGVISTLNERSGKRVEALDPKSAAVDPSAGSHDIDEHLPHRADDVRGAIEPAMKAMGCEVTKRRTDQVECYRNGKHAGRTGVGGETVIAAIQVEGTGARVHIATKHGIAGRNWSMPIFRELTSILAEPKRALQ